MADSFIQLPADSTGKQLDTALVNMGVGTTAVHREKIVIADPLSTSAFATVTSSQGIQVSSTQAQTISGTVTVLSASSGLVQISGTPTVTATAGTNPWSSAPGFNVPVVSVSSGLIQAFQVGTWTIQTTAGTAIATSSAIGLPGYFAVTPTSSVAGAAIAPVTSSAGLLASLSSGTVSLSSQITVTATAGTNPWSSAPGFNVPIVSVSSGLVQLSSQITVTATGPVTVTSGLISVTSGTITSTAATNPWSSAPGFNIPIVSVSSGLVQLSSQITVTATGPVTITSGTVTLSSVHTVTATAGTNPWSSAPGFNMPVVNVSSGFIRAFPVGSVTSSGLTAYHAMSTGGAVATNVTTAPSALYGYSIFNSSAVPRAVKFYNSTAPTVGGSTAALLLTVNAPGSTGGGGANLTLPMGLYSSNGWSLIITAGMGDTDTGAPGTNDISIGMFYQT